MRLRSMIGALCASGSLGGAGAAPVTIELLPQVQVRGAQVRMAQIAHITSADLATLRRLLAVPLGAAPRPGEIATLDRAVLDRWLRSRAGMQGDELTWTGASSSAVSTASRELDGHEVVQAARQALQGWLATRSAYAQVQPLTVPAGLQLPEGELSLVVRPIDDTQPRKRMLVWVDAWVSERFVRTLPVTFEVAAWADAAVAAEAAPAGAPLNARSVAPREVDVTLLSAPSIAVGEAGAGDQRLRRAVRAGEVLTARHVEAAPTVSRGDWVTARSVAGAVALESRVEALQDGRVGQVIRVRQANAGSAVAARVTGQGQVEVQQ